MPGIAVLQQKEENVWVAQYTGNHGTYTVELQFLDRQLRQYSCSCPSRQLPCKHIGIVLDAVGLQVPVDTRSFDRRPALVNDVVFLANDIVDKYDTDCEVLK